MMSRKTPLLGALWAMLLAAVAEPQEEPQVRKALGFESDVAPFLQRNCLDCHGPEKKKGDLSLEGYHDLSHHGGDRVKQEKIGKINRFHITQFAYLLEKLKAIPEGEGTLLDSCMLVYGSGLGDGTGA